MSTTFRKLMASGRSEMIKRNLHSVYFCFLLVVLFPITVVLNVEDDRNEYYPNAVKSRFQVELQSNIYGEKSNNNGKRTHTLAETLRQTLIEFEELFENMLDIVATNAPKIARDAEILLAELSNRTVDILNILSKKILREDNDLLNEMLRNVERQLESVRFEFQNLATNVDEYFNWAVVQLNHTLINNTEEYDWWTAHIKQRLRTVNDTKLYQEGCRAIDDFIANSTRELDKCCKITMKPVRSLCKSASSFITEALYAIVNALDRIQACLEEKNSYLEYMLPCINVAYDEISGFIFRAAQITHQVRNMLPMRIIYTRSCFAIVKVEMNVRRNNIESRIFSN